MNENDFQDRMNAGSAGFRLTYSSLWHLVWGGTRLAVGAAITILRVVLLLDVSKWQGEINFPTMKLGGADGVIIKCGQGLLQDLMFVTNWAGAKGAGIPRGTYWYYDSRVEPKEQARLWWEWIRQDPGELKHFVDYEENYGGPYRGHVHLRTFMQEFLRLSRLPVSRLGLYTGYYYWIANAPTTAAGLAWFAQFELWLAWYTSNPANVLIPRPWTNDSLVLWQYGTPANGFQYGAQSRDIDENNFNGDKEAFARRYNLDGDPSPPTPGDTMELEVRSNESNEVRSIRSGPEITRPKIVDLPAGGVARSRGRAEDIYEYSADIPNSAYPGGFSARSGDKWVRIYSVNGTPVQFVESWLAVRHLGVVYTTLRELGTPATRTPLTVNVTLSGVGYVTKDITETLEPEP